MDPRLDPDSLLVHDAFVRRLARRLIRDEARAEDLVQDTWVAALEGVPRRGASAGSGRAWLATVARRLWTKRRRGDLRRARRESAAARPEASELLDEVLAREETRRRLLVAVAELDELYRTALLLRWFEELPPRAIARRLELPVETVKTRLKRGLALLRARLDEQHGGDRSAWSVALLPLALPAPSNLAPSTLLAQLALMSTATKTALLSIPLVALALLGGRAWLGEAPRGPAGTTRAGEPAPQVEPPRSTAAEEPDLVAAAAELVRSEVEPPASSVPEVPREPASLGTLALRVRWSDESPAAGIPVEVVDLDTPNRWIDKLLLRTDAAGALEVERPAPTQLLVHVVGSLPRRVRLAAGETTELPIDLARGFDVEGEVVDERGAPVQGAVVRMSHMNPDEARHMATTDTEGRFAVRSWDGLGWIGAEASGFAPSLVQTLSGGEGARVSIRLVLPGAGGAVEGLVVDPDGDPVGAAEVLFGEPSRPGRGGWTPRPLRTTTGEDGRFRLDGATPGTATLAVRGAGFAPRLEPIDVVAGGTTNAEVVLDPGVELFGLVRDESGAPLAGAEVEHFLRNWRYADVTDVDGAYRLEELPAGEIELSIEHQGTKQSSLAFGNPGDVVEWNVVLGTGLVLAGRVVDEAGAPLVGWAIRIESASATDFHLDDAVTDDQGRFSIATAQDRDYRLTVSAPESFSYPSLAQQGVRPPAEELELTVPEQRMPTVFVVGRVQDAQGVPAGDAMLLLSHGGLALSNGPVEHADGTTGEFRVGPLPAGEWTLLVVEVDGTQHRHGPREVLPGETWDLGVLRLP